jgi:hypothetical protein
LGWWGSGSHNCWKPAVLGWNETKTKEPAIAKRRKPRPTGPPPAPSPKRERDAETAVTKGPKLKPGEPAKPAPGGVLKRAGFISAAYVLVLIFILHISIPLGVAIGFLGFAVMVPMGLLIDRWRYRSQMRKWTASRAGTK